MKFMEKRKKIGNHIAEDNIYICQNQKRKQKKNFKENTEDTLEQKSFSDRDMVPFLLNFRKEE
jgi:hypothetical protein